MEKRVYTIDRELDSEQIRQIRENAGGSEIRYNIAINLNKIFRKKNISARWLAEESGVAASSISAYSQAKSEPSATQILKIAKAVGTTCDFILSGTETGYVDIHDKTGLDNDVIEKLCELSKDKTIWGRIKLSVLNKLLGADDFEDVIKGICYARFIKIKSIILDDEVKDDPEYGSYLSTNQFTHGTFKGSFAITPAEYYPNRIERLKIPFDKAVESAIDSTLDGKTLDELKEEENLIHENLFTLMYGENNEINVNTQILQSIIGVL